MPNASEWTTRRLGDLVTLTSGQSPSGFAFAATGTPYYKVDQLGRASKYLAREATPYLAVDAPQIPAPSVLIAKRGAAISLNRVCLTVEPSFMDTNVMALTPRNELGAEFLYYWLSKRGLWDVADVASVPQINNKHIRPLAIALPEPAEQTAIVGALSNVDLLVAAVERLIAKREAMKHGLMQELLTGRTRLPGFRGKCSESRVGDVTTWLSGGTPHRGTPAYWNGTVPWISAATLKTTLVRDSPERLTPAGLQAGSRLAPKGASLVLVRGMALHRETRIGLAIRPVSFNQDVKALVPHTTLLPEFLLYALQARGQQILDLVSSAGSGTGVIDTRLLRSLPIWVPDGDEQRAVACVISDVDHEITALRARLEKANAVKQGMMQELLTGRTRLPIPGLIAATDADVTEVQTA